MNFEALVKHISTIQNTLQAQAAHAVNLALTSRNWLMGCYIVEFEQNGEDRAAYGEQLLKKLEQRLKTKGLNERRFREFRRLYLVYPQLKESVTQYIASQIQIRQSLTAEQIASLYYERSGLSKNKEALSALVQQQVTLLQPKDVINTPVTLEFLGLNERALVTENDLEQSILDNLQHFLLEMGHGFCFEARQKRILIDEDYFFADLVFYHRILKCHIIVELKIDKFRHEYASQLNMYLNYFKAEVMQPDDNPPIGILLCTEKGDTLVKYATAGLDPNIFVQKYMIELPTEEEIKEFISSSNY